MQRRVLKADRRIARRYVPERLAVQHYVVTYDYRQETGPTYPLDRAVALAMEAMDDPQAAYAVYLPDDEPAPIQGRRRNPGRTTH